MVTTMSQAAEKLLAWALQARREGRFADAKRDLVGAVDVCRRDDNRMDLARALTALGQIERDLQNWDAARQRYEEAVDIYLAENNPLKLAHAVRHLGDIHRHAGHPEFAESCYVEALNLYRSDKRTAALELANAIRSMAILKHDSGETEQAKSLWTEARDLYAAVNVKEGVAESSRRLALLSSASGR